MKGAASDVDAFAATSDYVSEKKIVDGTAYALLLSSIPLQLPMKLSGVSFRELRMNAADKLAWLWKRLDEAVY